MSHFDCSVHIAAAAADIEGGIASADYNFGAVAAVDIERIAADSHNTHHLYYHTQWPSAAATAADVAVVVVAEQIVTSAIAATDWKRPWRAVMEDSESRSFQTAIRAVIWSWSRWWR